MTVCEFIAYLQLAEPYKEVRVHVGDRCYGVGRFEMDPEEPEVVVRLTQETQA